MWTSRTMASLLILFFSIGTQLSLASEINNNCVGTHISGRDTVVLAPLGTGGSCVYCLRPADWAYDIDQEISLSICEAESRASNYSRSQCDSLRRESDRAMEIIRVKDSVEAVLYASQRYEFDLCKKQSGIKDSIRAIDKQLLEDQKELTSTWRKASFGLLLVVLLEGFIIYWTNR